MTQARCPTCGEPCDSDGYCWPCDDDARQQRQIDAAWLAYAREFSEKYNLIVEAANQACTDDELAVIRGGLMEWPEERIAESLGVTVSKVRAIREQAHEKIREAIGQGTVSELGRRRRYRGERHRGAA